MNIDSFINECQIIRNAQFSRIGYVDSAVEGLLTYADTQKHLNIALQNPNISVLITKPEFGNKADIFPGLAISDEPRSLFYKVHEKFFMENLYKAPFDSQIGTNCSIHPSSIISEQCYIGDNVTIGEQVVIKGPVRIGNNVTIEAGVKIGVDGILYMKSQSNHNKLIPHGGYVEIKDHAILMTNAVVVRSIHDTECTIVGEGSLVGLGSIVGHDAKLHKNVVISNQCVIARRTSVGENAFIGTNSTIKESLVVGQNARVMAGSIVISDVADNESVSGNFATNHQKRMFDLFRMKHKSR